MSRNKSRAAKAPSKTPRRTRPTKEAPKARARKTAGRKASGRAVRRSRAEFTKTEKTPRRAQSTKRATKERARKASGRAARRSRAEFTKTGRAKFTKTEESPRRTRPTKQTSKARARKAGGPKASGRAARRKAAGPKASSRAARRSRAKSTKASRAKYVRPAERVLHLDAFSGIAGNMFLGALLDLGLSRRELEADLAGLGVEFRMRVRRVQRGALAARYVDVQPGADRGARHHHHHGRTYRQIRELLGRARLAEPVRERALAIFEALARAEAAVHGTSIDKVHFHEVGAVDALVDVTGAAIGLERLGVERVSASPVALGGGSVETEHGRLPLPAPATLELLRGIPTVPAHVDWETVTPTGAAILRTLASSFGSLPAMTVEQVGHGAGDDRPGPMPNVLRAVLGRSGGPRGDRVAVLETHLDDLVPEHFDHLMERLFEAGALDVSLQHLQMKKNRPGVLVRVLARPADRISMARLLFAESTAIGVRISEQERIVLEREMRRVDTRFGRIAVKVVWDADGHPLVSAEYDDCKRAARRSGAPLREVVRVAEEAGREQL